LLWGVSCHPHHRRLPCNPQHLLARFFGALRAIGCATGGRSPSRCPPVPTRRASRRSSLTRCPVVSGSPSSYRPPSWIGRDFHTGALPNLPTAFHRGENARLADCCWSRRETSATDRMPLPVPGCQWQSTQRGRRFGDRFPSFTLTPSRIREGTPVGTLPELSAALHRGEDPRPADDCRPRRETPAIDRVALSELRRNRRDRKR
jgi:hypothetical protein